MNASDTAALHAAQSDKFEQIEERIMAEVPRSRDGREVLRVRFVRARTPDGKEVAYHDVREFYRDNDGAWRPGRKGITVRGRELRPVAVAFLRAVAGSVPTHLHAAAKELVAALLGSEASAHSRREELPHEVYDRRARRAPR